MDDDPSPASRPNTLAVHVSSAVGRLPLGRARVAAIAEGVLRGERCHSAVLTVTFVSDRAIAQLHRRHLQVAGPTDIITFQHAPTHLGGPRVGDIYIAPGVARRHARTAGCSWREELARLTVHGVLHTLGWEHPDGEQRMASAMWRRQERWVRRLAEAGAW
jgi:probable rRNA maturation factor